MWPPRRSFRLFRPGHHDSLNARVELHQLRVQLGEGLPGKGGQYRLRVIQKPEECGADLLGDCPITNPYSANRPRI